MLPRLLAPLTLLCCSAVVACAAAIPLTTNLGGPTSTGASTTGTGLFTGILDTLALTLNVNVAFSNLTSPTGGANPPAHIHQASVPGGTGPVIIPFPGFPTALTGGTYSQILNLTPTQYNNLVAALTAGTAYVNLHTVAFPAGEIRGDLPATPGLSPVPEPSSVWLLLAGFLLFALGRMRRRSV